MTQTEIGAWMAVLQLHPWLKMRSGHFCFVTDWGHTEKSSGFVLTKARADADADKIS
jgi:hypothetical protein